MSDAPSRVFVRISGPALEVLEDWKSRCEAVHEKRQKFQREIGSEALCTRGTKVIGFVPPEDFDTEQDHIRVVDSVPLDGKRVKAYGPDKRYSEGKSLATKMYGLTMPPRQEVFAKTGIPSGYVVDNRMIRPGLEEVGGDWYATEIHASALEDAELMEGCEVIPKWQFLKIKDEQDV